jgi:hypothetical protein
MSDRRRVETAPHEFTANLNFNADGLTPWFAAARAVTDGGGSVEGRVQHDGTAYEVTLYYQDSSLNLPDGGVTPAGTSIDFETIREFRIDVTAADGGRADAGFNAHLRPRWDGLTAETDDGGTTPIPVPDDLANDRTDAVNIRVSGSNIEFDRYLPLLRRAADAVGLAGHYFAHPHRTSNIQDAARYVRVHRDDSGPIHARDGPLVNLAHVLENDREGYRKLVQNDDDHHGRNRPGYYHTTTLGPERVREVWPDHSLPVEVKHYYETDAYDRAESDPLAHPKLEVSYQVSRWDDTLRFTDDTLGQLRHELDETIYSVLADAGLSVLAGEDSPFVEDEYFTDTNTTTDAEIVALDLAEVRHRQENIVVRHLADGLSPVEQDALDALVTDGGQVAPADIAESYDRHMDAVYRALDRMEDMVQHEYGEVSLQSTYVAELVNDALDAARDGVERAVDATSSALDAADRGLDETTSAFVAWAARNDLQVDDADDGVEIEFGDLSHRRDDPREVVRRLLREGYRLWQDMNRDPATFRMGSWRARWEEESGPDLKSVDLTETRTFHRSGKNWRTLEGR